MSRTPKLGPLQRAVLIDALEEYLKACYDRSCEWVDDKEIQSMWSHRQAIASELLLYLRDWSQEV